MAVDITRRKDKEDALRISEEKYRILVENSLQGLTIIQDGRCVFCNRAFADITGYSIEELLTFNPEKFAAMMPFEDQTPLISHNRRAATGGRDSTRHYECRIIGKDRSIRWVESSANATEYNGRPAVQVVHLDVTERRQAERSLKESKEFLDQIINSIGDPIFIKDRKHLLILFNDAFCSFTDKSREQLLGKTGFEDIPRDQAITFFKQDEHIFNTGENSLNEDKVTDSKGVEHTIMTRKALLKNKNGDKLIVGLIRNITEYKRLEAQFFQAQKMEAVGVMAGGIAHDFNNLLSVINGYSELLLEEHDPDSPMHLDLEKINKAGHHAASLTTQLLAFSRKQILQPQTIDLNAAVEDMSSMLRRIIGEDVEFVFIPGSNLGFVNADPGQLQQIVMNLAANARDAMPRGGKLIIETANTDFNEGYIEKHPIVMASGLYVMLAISDNGQGMDAKTKARIFEPFYTTKEKGRGTGLGLSTVYGIVKQSKGYIWVYSEPGGGTTFKIYFPRADGEISKQTGNPQSDTKGSETILVVEDDESVRKLTVRILQNQGYQVIEATDGFDAVRIARESSEEIHLLLTDVVMPTISGKVLASQIQALRPGVKILFVSGYTDNAIVHHGILDADVSFLQKPFTKNDLTGKIREVIDS
jgi:two-component system cell cycle sensor histidine kinase/response regulator CckA